ncbi:extracellular solute-binding protein [Hungatella hathewayi]|nr:extracellular solute-binding protein [Hungatella hathewayi]
MFDEGLAVTAKDAGMTWDGEVFAGEKCAMSTGGPWYVGMMAESAPDVNYSFIPMPGGNGNSGVTLHSYGIAVVKDAENAELAAKAAYYLSREEAQIARAEITGDRPSIESALVSFREKNPALAVIDEYIGQATGFGYPADQEFKTDFSTALESHVYAGDTTTAQEILDTLAEKYGNQ